MSHRDWPDDLAGLREILREEIIPEWESHPHDSTRNYPTTRWLRENGFSHLRTLLQEKHELTYKQFCEFVVNVGDDSTYDWSIDDAETIKYAERFLTRWNETRGNADSTMRTNRSSLNTTFGYFAALHDEESLYGMAQDTDRNTELYSMCEDLIMFIKDNHAGSTAYKYLRIIQRFYEWLDRRHLIEYNPVAGLEAEFQFDRDVDPKSLTDEQIRALWEAADSVDEHVLIVGYVFWGLRTEELPRIHCDQFVWDADDPRYEFSERKNGPGTISVEHGLTYVAELFDQRRSRSDFDGTLFDADDRTLKRRFNQLATRADVTIDGSPANPQHGRNYWMDLRMDANLLLLESAREVIPDRGSQDPHTAVKNYTDEEMRRKYRRHIVRHNLQEILPELDPLAADSSLSDITNQREMKEYCKEELRDRMDLT